MKYSENFERDYDFYLSKIEVFNFDGNKDYFDKKGNSLIVFDKNGVSAKEAFYIRDSQGKIVATREPDLLKSIYKCKGSVNMQIKIFAEDRANGLLPKFELNEFADKINAPKWFIDAVEEQKFKYPLLAFPLLSIQ